MKLYPLNFHRTVSEAFSEEIPPNFHQPVSEVFSQVIPPISLDTLLHKLLGKPNISTWRRETNTLPQGWIFVFKISETVSHLKCGELWNCLACQLSDRFTPDKYQALALVLLALVKGELVCDLLNHIQNLNDPFHMFQNSLSKILNAQRLHLYFGVQPLCHCQFPIRKHWLNHILSSESSCYERRLSPSFSYWH